MDLGTLSPEAVEAVFTRHGAHSITLSDARDAPVLEPAPGETPLWQDTRITGLFPPTTDFVGLEADLRTTLDLDELPEHDVVDLEDRAWEREWLRDFGPMRFGERLWIRPGGAPIDDDGAIIVDLDPGLAFGTGTHPTTGLCLEWLDGVDLDGKTLLDYGCGSGVLAVAALKLGCRHAVATDIDPQAIRATEENAARNGVADRLTTEPDAAAIDASFDVVVANILAAPLIELAGRIASRVGGGCSLALSGILSGQVGDVLAAYEPWISFDEPTVREQGGQVWARLTGRRTKG